MVNIEYLLFVFFDYLCTQKEISDIIFFSDAPKRIDVMDVKLLNPRRGDDCLRIDDSDDLVVMENIGSIPDGEVCANHHGIVFICTEGRAQFEYDGMVVQVQKNDLFLYMRHSVARDFMASSNFNCRQIWFTASEMWSINMYGTKSLADLVVLKQHPLVHLTDYDVELLDGYFRLLCHRMRHPSPLLHGEIVRSLVSTMMLEMLAMMRRNLSIPIEQAESMKAPTGLHGKMLAEKFMQMVEQSDGRSRRVDDFANMLNVTPKYLSVLLKETMNRRPSEIIRLFTLKAIEYRLRFTDMTMQQISNDLKFPNASFFGKYVKEHLGMTPLEYRKKYHK